MSDQPETLDKIIAEMHDFCSGWSEDVDVTVKVGLIYGWECRLDAAAERERNAHTNDIHDALYKATGIPGNVAAMREALNRVCYLSPTEAQDLRQLAKLCYDQDIYGGGLIERTLDDIEIARAALAAPARNCDQFATAEEARAAFEAKHSRGIVRNLYTATFDWLFARAEGGGHV